MIDRCRKDRRCEFYDVRGGVLTVRLKFDGSFWASFVEHQPNRRAAAREGMRHEFEEREPAVDVFRATVRRVFEVGGWKPVCDRVNVPWDLHVVDPRHIDEVEV